MRQSFAPHRPYSIYYLAVVGLFPLLLALSNILSAAKMVQLVPAFTFLGMEIPMLLISGGTLLFPITYLFGDILTEVYGYSETRKVIWIGFLGLLLSMGGIYLVGMMPAPPFWQLQGAYEQMFYAVWRINIASLCAYFLGEFLNSYVLAKMKLGTEKNKHIGWRFVASTAVGQGADTVVFVVIAFAGTIGNEHLVTMVLCNWIFKVCWEVIALPVTIPIVKHMKEVDQVDVYGAPSFSPFDLREETK